MNNANGGYGYGDLFDKRPALREAGCNDNDEPNHDNTMTLAVPDRRRSNGFVTAASRQTVAKWDTEQLRGLAGWYREFAAGR